MNNKIFVSGRKTGKTTSAIVESLETGRYILVANKKMAEVIYKKSKELGLTIHYPITMQEWFDGRVASSVKSNGVIIDEGLIFLEQLLGTKIHLITMSEDKGTTKITNNEYEVVIPQFVANFIQATKPNNSLRLAFEYIAQRKIDNHDDELALWIEEGNSELFASAWLDGYEVEKEKKYYVLDSHGKTILFRLFGKQIAPSQGRCVNDLGKQNIDYQFTEQEIKEYDKRYWQFAEEVTE